MRKTMRTYDTYLAGPKSLSVSEMAQLHKEIILEINEDEEGQELYDEIIKTAIDYVGIRASWAIMSKEEKSEKNPKRTECHNMLIVKFDALSDYLRQRDKAAAWREILGYEEENKYCRKRIGDFACYLAFINGLNTR